MCASSISGISTDNIFNLVYRFGSIQREDAISACFGFALKANPVVLIEFMKTLNLELAPREVGNVVIETQVTCKKSRIDLVIQLEGEFLVFLESKLEMTPLGKDQLLKYARILQGETSRFRQTRLVFVTQFDRSKDFQQARTQIRRSGDFPECNVRYARWENVRRIIISKGVPQSKYLNDLFLEYIGDTMSDRKIMREQKIKDVHQVLVQSTLPEWWELIVKKKVSTQWMRAPEAQFIAFYRTDKHAITHIAEVEYSELEERGKTFRGFPKLIRKMKEGKVPLNEPHKVYHLKEIIELARPIGKPGPGPRDKWFKPLTKFLKARTLADLKG